MSYLDSESERRSCKRASLNTSIRYKFKFSNEFGSTLTKDISEGGIRLTLDKFIPINTDFIVELSPSQLSSSVNATGRVVWAQKLPHSEWYHLGLEFRDISDQQRKSIDEYVSARRFKVPQR